MERAADPGDGRAKLVRFTARGRAFLRDSERIVSSVWEEYGERLAHALRQEPGERHLRGARAHPVAEFEDMAYAVVWGQVRLMGIFLGQLAVHIGLLGRDSAAAKRRALSRFVLSGQLLRGAKRWLP